MIKGYKFLVNEEEKSRILNLHKNRTSSQYLILEEQRCDWETYQNGDGTTKPKIDVEKNQNGVTVTFQGPETGFCIQHKSGSTTDTIHQTCGVAAKEVGNYLKELYNGGTFVKPDLEKIEMEKKDKFLKIVIPFISTTEDKAITNFDERGGWGHEGEYSALEAQLKNKEKYALVEVVKKVAIGGSSKDITERWFNFRNIEKFPIKTQSSQNSSSETTNTNSEEKNNSQSQTQTETKIKFQKPTDHKTALDQIKKELGVEQGYSISDAVLNFLKANTPKN